VKRHAFFGLAASVMALLAAHAEASAQQTQGMAATLPRIEVVRVRPADLTNPRFRLGDGPIDLMRNFSLSSSQGVGAAWQVPAHVASGDTFDERYGEW
jgi:hypothetical protein